MQHLLHTILIDTIMVHLLFVLNPANEAQIFNFYNKASIPFYMGIFSLGVLSSSIAQS